MDWKLPVFYCGNKEVLQFFKGKGHDALEHKLKGFPSRNTPQSTKARRTVMSNFIINYATTPNKSKTSFVSIILSFLQSYVKDKEMKIGTHICRPDERKYALVF